MPGVTSEQYQSDACDWIAHANRSRLVRMCGALA
jgi:hypothetical protein